MPSPTCSHCPPLQMQNSKRMLERIALCGPCFIHFVAGCVRYGFSFVCLASVAFQIKSNIVLIHGFKMVSPKIIQVKRLLRSKSATIISPTTRLTSRIVTELNKASLSFSVDRSCVGNVRLYQFLKYVSPNLVNSS